MNQYQQLCKILIDLERAFERYDLPGATGTRRKLIQGLQQIEEAAEAIRAEVLDLRKS